jgi:hypothetical protein
VAFVSVVVLEPIFARICRAVGRFVPSDTVFELVQLGCPLCLLALSPREVMVYAVDGGAEILRTLGDPCVLLFSVVQGGIEFGECGPLRRACFTEGAVENLGGHVTVVVGTSPPPFVDRVERR